MVFHVKSSLGEQKVSLRFADKTRPLLHYRTTLRCYAPTRIPFWPRDVVVLSRNGSPSQRKGEIHVAQKGARSGLLYFSLPKSEDGALFYFQNLSGLSDYCEATGTSAVDVVGGVWPELGLALPATNEKSLPANREIVISDALIVFHPKSPKDEIDVSKQFLDSLAQVYLQLDLPKTEYPDWPEIAKKSLHDLENCPGCWTHVSGHDYLNAYVSDYDTPPESMVQLAVLLPLVEYEKCLGDELPIIKRIEAGLPGFYDPRIGCVARWLPETEEGLHGDEPQKKPRVMDSWYQLHTLLNLSRMAMHGNKIARKLFLSSIDYAIKVAHRFKYQWPVFYNVDTLEIIKAETAPGEGGERDVSGSYAHVMLQAWKLTKKKRYLQEAKKSAMALRGGNLQLLYQSNNTAFASGALLELWKITGDENYLNLSYLCLANLFKNVWLWEGKYGHGKVHSTFFALFPLDDAPYTAVYEEQEVFAALSHYIVLAQDGKILPSVRLLIAEFIRYISYKAIFYYPPLLPDHVVADKTKTGEMDKQLWIPVEDMGDLWEKAGQVGQEVYGAGQAFGFLTRHYIRVPEQNLMVYVDYPVTKKVIKDQDLSFRVGGDRRLKCTIRLIPYEGKKLPKCVLTCGDSTINGHPTSEGHLQYVVQGAQSIHLGWSDGGNSLRQRRTPKGRDKV